MILVVLTVECSGVDGSTIHWSSAGCSDDGESVEW